MIFYLKEKYYWYKINQKLKLFFKNKRDIKILMYGYPKSGNTWLRFLLYNYCNLLLNPNVDKTISFDKLNNLQNNVMDRGTIFNNFEGFPLFYRTHKIYVKPYDLYDKKIFVHRNPLDTLISSYYFYKNRDIPFFDDPEYLRDRLHDIDFYVLYKIDHWINFYNISVKHADFVINYSQMKSNCKKEFLNLINFLEWDLHENLVEKSIEISSFKKVKKMGKDNLQQYGNGPSDGSFKGEFTRSGKEAQFNKELNKETIEKVLNKFPEFQNLYPNCIEKE